MQKREYITYADRVIMECLIHHGFTLLQISELLSVGLDEIQDEYYSGIRDGKYHADWSWENRRSI